MEEAIEEGFGCYMTPIEVELSKKEGTGISCILVLHV
jgi:hypothetical protein